MPQQERPEKQFARWVAMWLDRQTEKRGLVRASELKPDLDTDLRPQLESLLNTTVTNAAWAQFQDDMRDHEFADYSDLEDYATDAFVVFRVYAKGPAHDGKPRSRPRPRRSRGLYRGPLIERACVAEYVGFAKALARAKRVRRNFWQWCATRYAEVTGEEVSLGALSKRYQRSKAPRMEERAIQREMQEEFRRYLGEELNLPPIAGESDLQWFRRVRDAALALEAKHAMDADEAASEPGP
jgi:hypothetical protein